MNEQHGETQTRLFTLVLGVLYLVVGILGFVPALRTAPPFDAPHLDAGAGYGYLFGLFPINDLHNVVHILIGIFGIALSAKFSAARLYCRTLFVLFGVLTFLGFLPQADVLFGLIPIFSNDTWLNAVSAIIVAYFGYVATEPTRMEGAHEAA